MGSLNWAVSSKRILKPGGPLSLFIKTEWVGIWIALVAAVAIFTDLTHRRIYNWLTFPAMVTGLVISFSTAGPLGLFYGFIGILIAMLAFGWMWKIQMVGAGDVKLLMAFGALSGAATAIGKKGLTFTADLALLSLIVGGVAALVLLIVKGRFVPFLRKFYRFLITFLDKNLETEFPKADPTLQMPFGISIAIATVWVWFDNPLVRWGIRPWN